MRLPYSARVRRSTLPLVVVLALVGCSGDDADAERTATTQPAASTQTEQPAPAQHAARGPVRLLLLGRFNQPTYITSPRGDSRRFVVEREGRIRVLKGRRPLGTPF